MTAAVEEQLRAHAALAEAAKRATTDDEARAIAAQIRDFTRQVRAGAEAVQQRERVAGWATPGDLAVDLFRGTVQTPALRLIDEALVDLVEQRDGRLIVTIPFQEGKSTRISRDFLLWWLTRDPERRIVTASYGQSLANRNGRVLRNAIQSYPELGLALAADNSSAREWQLAGHAGGLYGVGVGGALIGRAADGMIIDDPIKNRAEADSEVYRQRVWDWWLNDASGRLSPGAPVVVVLTRWHEDDLAGRLLDAPDGDTWRVLNIPAQADHDPTSGETDPLGREPGEYLVSARGRTDAEWEAIKVRVGSKVWNSSYQGRPTAAAGDVFQRGWWRYYDVPQWTVDELGRHLPYGFDATLVSWDMTFKDKATSDYVVGTVWGRRGGEFYLLDLVRAQMGFVASAQAVKNLWAKWPTVVVKLIEDKANGSAVINYLEHEVVGILPEEPAGSKYARASGVSPLVEAGRVVLPDPSLAPWVEAYVDELAAFPNGRYDDQTDSTSQALNRLALAPPDAVGDTVTTGDFVGRRWSSPI